MAMITIDILLYGMMNDVMAVQNSSVSVRLKSTWRFNPPLVGTSLNMLELARNGHLALQCCF